MVILITRGEPTLDVCIRNWRLWGLKYMSLFWLGCRSVQTPIQKQWHLHLVKTAILKSTFKSKTYFKCISNQLLDCACIISSTLRIVVIFQRQSYFTYSNNQVFTIVLNKHCSKYTTTHNNKFLFLFPLLNLESKRTSYQLCILYFYCCIVSVPIR